jgi:hypothetical protein
METQETLKLATYTELKGALDRVMVKYGWNLCGHDAECTPVAWLWQHKYRNDVGDVYKSVWVAQSTCFYEPPDEEVPAFIVTSMTTPPDSGALDHLEMELRKSGHTSMLPEPGRGMLEEMLRSAVVVRLREWAAQFEADPVLRQRVPEMRWTVKWLEMQGRLYEQEEGEWLAYVRKTAGFC